MNGSFWPVLPPACPCETEGPDAITMVAVQTRFRSVADPIRFALQGEEVVAQAGAEALSLAGPGLVLAAARVLPLRAGRYHLASDQWTPTSMLRAPTALWGGRWSVWTGTQMIVWGGFGPTQKGGLYCSSGQANLAPLAARLVSGPSHGAAP